MSNRIGVTSADQLLQIGSQREKYDHPVEQFVADFIGETAFLVGRVDGNCLRSAPVGQIGVI